MFKPYSLLILFVTIFYSSTSGQEIINVELSKTRSEAEVKNSYGLLAQNGVDLYQVLYTTKDLEGKKDTASGLLVVPILEETTMPMLVYQHGTVSAKDDVPSLLRGGYQLAEVCGALGYVSLAPDFLGLGTSRGLHPYVHADSEAWAAIDMLKAVKPYLPRLNIKVNDKLFITGYSQGGHAAMALHRELEQNYADEFPVTAAAPMSGPYSIFGEMKKLFLGDEPYLYPAYLAFAILSFDAAYGLFDELEEYFEPAFANLIRINLSSTLSLQTLNTLLITGLKQRHGESIPRYILQDSIQQGILTNPDHPLLVAMAKNDVYKWAPQAPTRLLYCTADDQVPYTNSLVALDTMLSFGASDVSAIDVETDADHGECVLPAITGALIFFAGLKDVETSIEALLPPHLRIFPNPANEYLSVQGLVPGDMVELYDMRGQLKRQWMVREENLEISVSDNWKGFHLLRITTESGSWTQKVMLMAK